MTQCRRLLEESIAQQLQGKYDIYATGKKDEVQAEKDVPLGHLTDEERQARQDILAHFEHIKALGYKPKETLEQLIREIAFTHLNRLCAYKMMEVRDVYVGGQKFREAVSKGLKSQGFLFYLADHPEDEKRYNAGHQEEAYRHFLNWLGGTLSQEIGVLFSPTDPANRVYPPQRVLDEVLDLLNSEELKGIWSEDETIGWVYQYFTPKELRDQARKESQAPRNSYELAFRNQFFTPRYVVEFLTDNTLGRIWYEMRKGNTRLKDECRYMVRRPERGLPHREGGRARLPGEGDEGLAPRRHRGDVPAVPGRRDAAARRTRPHGRWLRAASLRGSGRGGVVALGEAAGDQGGRGSVPVPHAGLARRAVLPGPSRSARRGLRRLGRDLLRHRQRGPSPGDRGTEGGRHPGGTPAGDHGDPAPAQERPPRDQDPRPGVRQRALPALLLRPAAGHLRGSLRRPRPGAGACRPTTPRRTTCDGLCPV